MIDVIIKDRKIPKDWEYEKSVEKIKTTIYKWKNITAALLHELWIAREVLDGRGGDRKSINYKSNVANETFENYCSDIGIHRSTAHRWLSSYDPERQLIRDINKIVKDEFILRPIIDYGENIYLHTTKIQDTRNDAHYVINNNDKFPTLKRRSWFYHSDQSEFTLREYARVQTFPNSFKFVGTYETIKDQIGNAVAPQMAKFLSNRFKGKTIGDLFCGAGGMSEGFKQGGKKILWGVEYNRKACPTYKVNHPNTTLFNKNIKDIDINELDYVDIIVGGPPCQGLSPSGKRFINDPRNELYKEFVRIVKGLKSKEILMENVVQIKNMKDEIIKDFNKIGYDIEFEIIRGEDIGMRQHRNRAFFIGKYRG